jgi:hypothetical protein
MKAVIPAIVVTLALLASGSDALAEVSKTPVRVANFVRAESDHMIRANMEMVGVTFGTFVHLREPTTPDNQPVIRMNQDTLYSATVLALSKPVTLTLPEIGGRYMSMHDEFVAALPGVCQKLPEGWSVRVKTLEEDLIEKPEGGVATIMKDEFFNVYDRTGPGMTNYKP